MSIPIQFSIDQILTITHQLPDEIKRLLIKEWLKEFSKKKESNTTPTVNLEGYNEPLDLDKYAFSVAQLKGVEGLWEDELPIEELIKLI